MRDAIILGYQLQRVPGRDMLIPDWYANAESELGLGSGSPTFQMSEENSLMNSWDLTSQSSFVLVRELKVIACVS